MHIFLEAFIALFLIGVSIPSLESKYGAECIKKANEYAKTKPQFDQQSRDFYIMEYAEKNCTKLK